MGMLAKPSEAALELGMDSDSFMSVACTDIPLSRPCLEEPDGDDCLCGVVSSDSGPSVHGISMRSTAFDRDSGVKLSSLKPFFELEEVPSPLDWVPRRSA
jgi:hypothetical protein